MFTQSGRRDLTRPAASAAGAGLSPASGAMAPQAPKFNPRPPEPHAGQESYSKRQLVGFSMASERRRRMPLPEMSGLAARNGTNNSTTTTPRSTWTALGSLILHDGGQDDNACPLLTN